MSKRPTFIIMLPNIGHSSTHQQSTGLFTKTVLVARTSQEMQNVHYTLRFLCAELSRGRYGTGLRRCALIGVVGRLARTLVALSLTQPLYFIQGRCRQSKCTWRLSHVLISHDNMQRVYLLRDVTWAIIDVLSQFSPIPYSVLAFYSFWPFAFVMA